MTRESETTTAPAETLKNEFARQRWELFHRAIAHAKRTNNEAPAEAENAPADVDAKQPILSIVR